MYEEREDDRPEWEIEEEKIPPSLQKKLDREEERGLVGGICPSCGAAFTREDLSCPHCGVPVEIPRGFFVSLRDWLFKTPMGIILILIVIFVMLRTLF